MAISFVDHELESARQSARLGSHETELNRLDTALLAATKSRSTPPSSFRVFRALSDASIVCAEVIDAHAGRPIPSLVRIELARVHCAMTDVGASLAAYMALCLKAP
jgi:hypothetical protein